MPADQEITAANLYLFGDGWEGLGPQLQALLQIDLYPLSAFLENAYLVLRSELGQLPRSEREQIASFSSLQDLIAQHYDGLLDVSMYPALVCICQVASLIRHQIVRGGLYSSLKDNYVLGVGIGSLAAVATSCCTHVAELAHVALDIVRLALSVGLYTKRVRSSVDTSNSSTSWSMTITPLSIKSAQQIIADFHSTNPLPLTSHLYVSVIDDNQITISGAPWALDQLCRSIDKHFSISKENICAPYHASHLFDAHDKKCLLQTLYTRQLNQARVLPLLFGSSGKLTGLNRLDDLLETALEEILIKPIDWRDIAHGIAYVVRFSSGHKIKLHSFGNVNEDKLRLSVASKGSNILDPDDCEVHSTLGAAPRLSRSKIAIVGMSGRFPEAENLSEFWEHLVQGRDVHKEIPASRWNVATHYDPSGKRKNTSATPFGCWLLNPGLFDIKFFNMSPREAPQIDPASRISLMTTYEAMERAGMVPGATPSTMHDRVGVFYGVSSNDWMEANSSQNIDTYFIAGGCRAFIPGRINYFFKFSGGSFSFDTACSSSLAATHTACNALWQRDIDTAVVGGTNVLTNPDYTAGLDRGHFLSRTGNCKTFDNSADGYCRGEGVATLILKRLDDAIAEKDPILGLIAGAFTNHSAEAESITRPHIGAQKAIFRRILQNAHVDNRDVSYVEMHGTGTQAGDPVEMNSVLETLASNDPRYRRDVTQPLYLGSAKSNVGHGEGAAGATSLIKVLLMMRENTIPPHCGIKTRINERYPHDLRQRGVLIAHEAKAWVKPEQGSRKAFVNNFSAAGGNSTILLEDGPPERLSPSLDPRTSHLVTISAKTAASLEKSVQSLLTFIENRAASERQMSLPALSYTSTARRMHHMFRAAVTGTNLDEIKFSLRQILSDKQIAARTITPPKIVFAFSGNGTEYFGMGRSLYKHFSTFREKLGRLNNIAQKQAFPSILRVFEDSSGVIGNYTTCTVQLATLCLEIALAQLLISWGVTPSMTVGHSLGEYACLAIAGVLSESDAIYLVGTRAQLLEQRCTQGTHTMLAVKGTKDALRQCLLEYPLEIACINSAQAIVLGATKEAIRQAQDTLRQKDFKTAIIEVDYAFHTSQVDPILDDLEKAAQQVRFQQPAIPVLSSLKEAVTSDKAAYTPQYIRNHARSTVDMASILEEAVSLGSITQKSIILEVGPHPIFGSMLRELPNGPFTVLPTLKRNQDMWPILTQTLSSLYTAGADIDWIEYHRPFPSCQRVLQLPAYQWDLKDYWIQYVNDWSLRKGEPPGEVQLLLAEEISEPAPVILKPTASIHRLVSENLTKSHYEIIVETDLSHRELKQVVLGHVVNGVPLCTPGLYAEIALTLASHVRDKYKIVETSITKILEMKIEKALIAISDAPSQLLRTSARLDLGHGKTFCRFSTVDALGNAVSEHSCCTIAFDRKAEALNGLSTIATSARARLLELDSAARMGTAFRFNKHMIYRMVSGVATFDASYQGVDEMVLDSAVMDASSRLVLNDSAAPSGFSCHPIWLDLLSQSAGFVMNGNDHSNPSRQVFVNHGWRGLSLFEKLEAGRTYDTYVQMEETEHKKWQGDLLVFDGTVIVAYFEGITLQGLSRKALDFVLRDATRSRPAIEASGRTRDEREEPKDVSDPLQDVLAGREAQNKQGSPKESLEQLPRAMSGSAGSTQHDRTQASLLNQNAGISKPDGDQTRASSELASQVLQIICDESGVLPSELLEDVQFADLGIDSLLSLMIIARLREELPDFIVEPTLFVDYPTVSTLKRLFARNESHAANGISYTSSNSSFVGELPTQNPDLEDAPKSLTGSRSSPEPEPLAYIKRQKSPVPPATSIILQGRPRSSPRTLMLFPDGSGSATSYANVANGKSNLCIIALNSPYHRQPHEFHCPFDDLMVSYLTELRRRQPLGPYQLGGWSSGGILAYRAAQILIQEGELVQSLVLIDSPMPKNGLERLPEWWYESYESIGDLDKTYNSQLRSRDQKSERQHDDEVPWIIAHFRATIEVLHEYRPLPLPPGFTPKVTIVWASMPVRRSSNILRVPPEQREDQGVGFLTAPRGNFSAGDWASLFPGEIVTVEVLEGADHFSMMGQKYSSSMTVLLEQATSLRDDYVP